MPSVPSPAPGLSPKRGGGTFGPQGPAPPVTSSKASSRFADGWWSDNEPSQGVREPQCAAASALCRCFFLPPRLWFTAAIVAAAVGLATVAAFAVVGTGSVPPPRLVVGFCAVIIVLRVVFVAFCLFFPGYCSSSCTLP
jgi:hypothetical protein